MHDYDCQPSETCQSPRRFLECKACSIETRSSDMMQAKNFALKEVVSLCWKQNWNLKKKQVFSELKAQCRAAVASVSDVANWPRFFLLLSQVDRKMSQCALGKWGLTFGTKQSIQRLEVTHLLQFYKSFSQNRGLFKSVNSPLKSWQNEYNLTCISWILMTDCCF